MALRIDEESEAQHNKLASSQSSEDTESDPSTEFGSEGSDSECSDGEEDVVEKPFAVEDTILIFDWDDTLLPTTWIEQQGLRISSSSGLSEQQERQLQRMALLAKQTLQAAKSLGKVVIVTNAEAGWVELSCRKFMPLLCECLQDVKILSARSMYEHQGVVEPSEWKYLAFQNELARFCSPPTAEAACCRQVISIGDSPHERDALIRVGEQMQNSLVKAVKLMARPGVDKLCEEHELIGGCFRDIVCHDGNLDMCIGSSASP